MQTSHLRNVHKLKRRKADLPPQKIFEKNNYTEIIYTKGPKFFKKKENVDKPEETVDQTENPENTDEFFQLPQMKKFQ